MLGVDTEELATQPDSRILSHTKGVEFPDQIRELGQLLPTELSTVI